MDAAHNAPASGATDPLATPLLAPAAISPDAAARRRLLARGRPLGNREDAGESIVATLRELLHVRRVCLFRVDEPSRDLICIASAGATGDSG